MKQFLLVLLILLSFIQFPIPCPAAGWRELQLTKPSPDVHLQDVWTSSVQLSPDSSSVVYHFAYEWDLDWTGTNSELFAVPVHGGTPVKLNAPFTGAGGVKNYQITPDSQRVIYRMAESAILGPVEWSEPVELFSVPLHGGPSIKLNAPLPKGGKIIGGPSGFVVAVGPDERLGEGFRISPDSRRVVYAATQDSSQTIELYSVPVTGGQPVKLSGPMVAGRDILPEGFRISPDSQRVVYLADQEVNNALDLYSVPLSGGPAIKLSDTPLLRYSDQDYFSNYISQFEFWPLKGPNESTVSTHVLYQDWSEAAGTRRLCSVPLDGGPITRLSAPDESIDFILPSPDGEQILYLGYQTSAGGPTGFDLRRVPSGGGAATLIKHFPGESRLSMSRAGVTPDQSRIIYTQFTQETDGGLYSLDLHTGEEVKLNAPTPDSADQHVAEVTLTNDGTRVVYRGNRGRNTPVGLFSVPVQGGPVTTLCLGAGLEYSCYKISPDSQSILFDMDAPYGPFIVPITGGKIEPVSRRPDSYIAYFNFLPDGSGVVFLNPPTYDPIIYSSFYCPYNGLHTLWGKYP